MEAAEGYLLLGMPQQALREVDSLRSAGAPLSDTCSIRAEALRDLGRFEEALLEYERADDDLPDQLETLLGMAWCLKRIDRLDEALDRMYRAYRAFPDEPIVLYNIACYLALAGEKSQSLSWLGRALRMEPELRKLIPDESDFNSLRDDSDFQFIVADPRDPEEDR